MRDESESGSRSTLIFGHRGAMSFTHTAPGTSSVKWGGSMFARARAHNSARITFVRRTIYADVWVIRKAIQSKRC